ncbi:hypothetical protein CC85DRAFT_283165, partial [Cutaneotrichosporon oleaginosum]
MPATIKRPMPPAAITPMTCILACIHGPRTRPRPQTLPITLHAYWLLVYLACGTANSFHRQQGPLRSTVLGGALGPQARGIS